MNETDLTKILKDCPEGTKLYTTVWGEVTFYRINSEKPIYPIYIETDSGYIPALTKEGCYTNKIDAECILFPSKDQRDWSKFTAPWYKKEKFDPKTLQAFDKVLVKICDIWVADFYSHYEDDELCVGVGLNRYLYCIPYNEETKHLVGTTEEAPEYYRYWED